MLDCRPPHHEGQWSAAANQQQRHKGWCPRIAEPDPRSEFLMFLDLQREFADIALDKRASFFPNS